MSKKLPLLAYIRLLRLDKPIGTLLLLWPTLWALWLAGNGHPRPQTLLIFVLGVFFMRTAGCIINDICDRKFDSQVKRTRFRPLAKKQIPLSHAVILAIIFIFGAFLLVLKCNLFTIKLAFVGAALSLIYPLLKRVTHLPQVGLGIAYAWGVPMAFAAEQNKIEIHGWFLFATAMLWPIIYDTIYAMIDREDDVKIGIKSAAILFAQMDRLVIGLLQVLFITMLIIVGLMFHLHVGYYVALFFCAGFFVYQQWLISLHDVNACYRAFENNNWVGLLIFLGIFLSHIYPHHIDTVLPVKKHVLQRAFKHNKL